MTDRFSFDMQRFGGGKGGTTVTQTYEPTQWELTLQMVEATYSVAIMQPAIDLNKYASPNSWRGLFCVRNCLRVVCKPIFFRPFRVMTS